MLLIIIKSILNASSTEDCSDLKLLSNIFIALFSVSFIVNIVFIIFTLIYLRKTRRSANLFFQDFLSVFFMQPT